MQTAIKCPTLEIFYEVIEKYNIKWDKDRIRGFWEQYKKNTCIRPSDGTYCYSEYYIGHGTKLEDFRPNPNDYELTF